MEHEYKFLVSVDVNSIPRHSERRMRQGYLAPGVRIRYEQDAPSYSASYSLTVKGKREGISRVEETNPLSKKVGALLMERCDYFLEKTRWWTIGPGGWTWEIDIFRGANEGLILAELEVSDPNTEFITPEWCGKNVTDDDRYYNENLATRPYCSWWSYYPELLK